MQMSIELAVTDIILVAVWVSTVPSGLHQLIG